MKPSTPNKKNATSDNVTRQFHRVSNDFFGPLASKFIKRQSRSLSKPEVKKIVTAWAAIGRHPEPHISLITSYKTHRSENQATWKRLRHHLKSSAHLSKWQKPTSWPQLTSLIKAAGFEPLPTIVPYGQDLFELLFEYRILAVTPYWDGSNNLVKGICRILGKPSDLVQTHPLTCEIVDGKRTEANQRDLNYHLGLMKDLTYFFSAFALKQPSLAAAAPIRTQLLKDQRTLVEDTDPARTLLETATTPVPFDRIGLVKGPITPQTKWQEVVASAHTWPKEVQNAAAPLLDRGSKLPDWKSLVAFSKNLGFKAVPILGWVGGPVYTEMLTKREFPICSFWVMRYKKGPGHIVAVDALHDIGHGLSMAMQDYRELCVRFCRETLGWNEYLNSSRYLMDYIRFFELGYATNGDGTATPIGPVSFGLEGFKFDGRHIIIPPENQEVDRPYQFQSRDAWSREVSSFIDQLAKRKVRNLKLEASHRTQIYSIQKP